MRRSLTILMLATTGLSSCGQESQSSTNKASMASEIVDSTKIYTGLPSLTHDLDKYVYTDTLYKTSAGEGITIQNSFPKGGSIEPGGIQYVDSMGKTYAFAVFWTRIINKTSTPLALKIDFPANSLAIFKSPDASLKLFLPPDTMTFDKLSAFNYGITGLKSFLDVHFDKSTKLRRTINPHEESLFYVAALSYQASGTPRAAMALNEEDLYYNVSIAPHGAASIPSGKIVPLK